MLGLKPHSDLCALTVLLTDKEVGGLQVLRDGTWYSVPAVRDYSLLINIGVTLEVTILHEKFYDPRKSTSRFFFYLEIPNFILEGIIHPGIFLRMIKLPILHT